MSFRVVFVVFLLSYFSLNAISSVTLSNEYSWSQNGTNSFGNTVGPVSVDISAIENTPLSTYEFNLSSIPTDPFELKASAGFKVEIDQRNAGQNWSTVEVAAQSQSTLVATGVVEALGETSGTAIFTWVVTGVSDYDFDGRGPNALLVNQLGTSALLSSSVPADTPDLLVNQFAPLNGQPVGVENEQITSSVPSTTHTKQFVVPWTDNSIPIFFDLTVSAGLNVFNADAAGFVADVSADYSNTATLAGVSVYDANGVLIPDATITGVDGFDYTGVGANVPEPSHGLSLGFAVLFTFATVRKRRQTC